MRGERNLTAGVVGGVAGGLLFGAMMHMGGMIGMVAMLAGSASVAVGWIVHLLISVAFGLVYALVLGPATRSVGHGAVLGILYGGVTWVLGALVVMPVWLGMSDMVFAVGPDQIMSLVGHVMFGAALGVVYRLLAAGSSNAVAG